MIKNKNGFTLIEAILAVMMVVLIGILTARSLMHTTRAMVSSNENRRAARLAEMVIEELNNMAAKNFYSMSSTYHGQTMTPGAFFKTGAGDDLGFAGFKIQPAIEIKAGVANLDLKISWT